MILAPFCSIILPKRKIIKKMNNHNDGQRVMSGSGDGGGGGDGGNDGDDFS